ncbi:hypothetical protein D1P53_002545 [Cryptococcus gattii VGV]|nr:hypothetical protein D1P53_002545 [Cryptococcus gattii VGV]
MDDLLDLNWSAAPSPTPPPAFDFLSQPPPSHTPPANYHPPRAPPPAPSSRPPPAATAHNDAFSSLLSIPAPSATATGKNMTMAEKQAAIAEEKRQKDEAQRKQFEAHGAFWDNLLQPAPAAAPSKSGTFWDQYGDSDLKPKSKPASQPRSQARSPAPAQTATPPVVVVPADPFDFDAFEIETSKSGATTTTTSRSEMRTPVSHFDFGDGNVYAYDDDDDLLGELGKPPPASAAAPPPPAQSNEPQKDRASPPPHIVGQIVEMGFAPTQARQALAKTSTGLDVQQALDFLLAAGGPTRSRDGADVNTEAQAQAEAEAEAAEKERRRRRRAGPLRDSIKPATRPQPREEHEHGNDAQDQAERILAQASEIGQSMFNKATLFWNSSKERAIKVYEEQKKAAMEAAAAEKEEDKRKSAKSAARPRPKWMQQENEGWKDERSQVKGGFKDSDDDDDEKEEQGRLGKTTQSGNLLFDADHPGPSRPSSRPKPVARAVASSSPKPRPASSPKPPRQASPLPARTIVPATPHQLESSAAHKTKGNHHFKLGRFTEAESAYSSAIAALPRGNLFLIPLLTNRATARLKLGDSANAAGDCAPPTRIRRDKTGEGLSKAIVKRAQAWEMGEKWKAALDDWERVMGLDIVILGGGGGAASMRHMAAEGARRARRMMKMQGGETPSSSSVSTSVTTTTSTTTTTATTPRPVATSPAPSRPSASASASAADVNRSAAVADLRKAAQALEAEEEARLKHKDNVDTRITYWKAGKETNLRALIASLDTVLWDDIVKEGGLKVGMHELVTDKQVKIKYMKVIARLHPDKKMQIHPPIPPGSPPQATAPSFPPFMSTSTPPSPTTILPGPIILLILLPAIPLFLFSLGARPPDTSALPFSTNDLFVTTTLICLAGGTVLFLGVYPEVGGRVWGWIKDGGGGGGGVHWRGGPSWNDVWDELGMREMGDWMGWLLGGGGGGGGGQRWMEQSAAAGVQQSGRVVPRRPEWIWDERFRRWVRAPPPLQAQMMMDHHSRHVIALQEFQPKWYSLNQPRLIPSLIIIAFIIFFIIILVGNFLKTVYSSESSLGNSSGKSGGTSSENNSNKLPPTTTAWVERELRKRKTEEPKETIKRVEKEHKAEEDKVKKAGKDELEKWGKKRDKEKELLKKELEKKKMPLTGLEEGKRSKKDESKKEKKDKKDNAPEEGETKKSKTSKIKKLLHSEKADKTKDTGETWEPTDPNVAEVTIASSTANAQKEAERLKAGG